MAWALDEVEGQLREEPAHRLRNDQHGYHWFLTAPNKVSVVVDVVRDASGSETEAIDVNLIAGAIGLLPGHARAERRLLLRLDGHAAREPELLYLVFEIEGHVYAFETLDEAGDSLEALDLADYIGAFSDRGEVITMTPGDLWIEFTRTGKVDHATLQTLIRSSKHFSELAADPHRFALAHWWAS